MHNKSFIRWQKYTLNLLTYSVNLVIALSTAVLGFVVTLLINKDFPLSFYPLCSCAKILYLLSLLALLISIGLGIYCVINRLYDFRTTKNTARQREESTSSEVLESLRLKYEDRGKKTWSIFWGQILSFAFAILALIVSITIIYHEKLF